MDKISLTIDGIEIRATGENVQRGIDVALAIMHGKEQDGKTIENDVRWTYILAGKIPAIRLHREYMQETTGQTSLIESKRYVEEVCKDIIDLQDARSAFPKANELRDAQNRIRDLELQVENVRSDLNYEREENQHLSLEVGRLREEYGPENRGRGSSSSIEPF
jgi:hypothetical protein